MPLNPANFAAVRASNFEPSRADGKGMNRQHAKTPRREPDAALEDELELRGVPLSR
jgi:hypothetical protein